QGFQQPLDPALLAVATDFDVGTDALTHLTGSVPFLPEFRAVIVSLERGSSALRIFMNKGPAARRLQQARLIAPRDLFRQPGQGIQQAFHAFRVVVAGDVDERAEALPDFPGPSPLAQELRAVIAGFKRRTPTASVFAYRDSHGTPLKQARASDP